MKRIYFCTECDTILNPGTKIVLAAAKGSLRGLVLLSPLPGNYKVIASESLQLVRGDRVRLLCPICQASLDSVADGNLVEIGFREEEGPSGRVNFSRVYGEHATYFVTSGAVRSYGEDVGLYAGCNFFGEGVQE